MTIHTDDLTHHDMALMMAELATMFGGKKDLDNKTELYFRILGKYPLASVRAAVARVLEEEHKFFPLVGRLKAYAVEHQRGERALSRPAAEDPTRECSDCHEPMAYHRLVFATSRYAGPLLTSRQTIRHRDGCQHEPRQAEAMAFYGFTWVDTLPPEGVLEWMGLAHECRGVEQVIPILPRSLAEYEREHQEQLAKKKNRTPNPYPQPAPATPLSALVPPTGVVQP